MRKSLNLHELLYGIMTGGVVGVMKLTATSHSSCEEHCGSQNAAYGSLMMCTPKYETDFDPFQMFLACPR